MAEAQAQAQARAQIEIEVNRQQQQRLSDSMGTQVAASNVADFGCYAGMLMRAFGYNRRRKHPVRRMRCRRGDPSDDGAGAGDCRPRGRFRRNPSGLRAGRATVPAPVTPVQAAPQGQAQPSSSDMKRIEYERQNQQDWERRLGPVRVRTVKASLPEGSTDTDYLTALEQAFVHFHAHVMFQTSHQDQWEERVAKPRLIELKQGLPPGPLGLTDYLDRLEQAAKGSTEIGRCRN